MDDAAGSLADPENQIVILGSVVAAVEASHLTGKAGTQHRQVAGEVLVSEALGRPVRFLEQAEVNAALGDAVLIGVEVVDLRIAIDGLHHRLQGARAEQIVVIQQRNKLTRGRREGIVRGGRDASVVLALDHPDPLVGRSRGSENLEDLRI